MSTGAGGSGASLRRVSSRDALSASPASAQSTMVRSTSPRSPQSPSLSPEQGAQISMLHLDAPLAKQIATGCNAPSVCLLISRPPRFALSEGCS